MQFPQGKAVSKSNPFSGGILGKALTAIFKANREFSGYLRISRGDEGAYFLFILRNAVCGAGKYFNRRPEGLTIRECFRESLACSPEGMTVSLHEAPPELLDEFMIFTQAVPTVKAPASMIDLDAFLRRIREEGADALVVLEAAGCHNFFFISGGFPVTAHFSETGSTEEGLSPDEQMLLYAYRPGSEVEATIYRTTATAPAADCDDGTHTGVLALLAEALAPAMPAPPEEPLSFQQQEIPPITSKCIQVTVTEGACNGTSRTGQLPFTVGRKEGDLVIADPLMSRRHAIIREINGELVVEDLRSTNGTFVNGVEVKLQQLFPGDSITMGNTVFRVSPV